MKLLVILGQEFGQVSGFSFMSKTGVSEVCQLAIVSGRGVFLSLAGFSIIRVKNLGGLIIELRVLVVLALLAKVGGWLLV